MTWPAARKNKNQQASKKEQGIDALESNIPTAKTSNVEYYNYHLHYMHENYARFFRFYNMNSAKIRMKNFISKQKALDESVNILINGGKKIQ
ncbi:hypothetical protein EDC94DRAFT_288732 [Helicostylum pulchrum]|nr:hypothetical protein EDC94DRAFT_288732 [Helicostylum pulchrum]